MLVKTNILPLVLLLAASPAFSQNAAQLAEKGKRLMNENQFNAAIATLTKAAAVSKKSDDIYAHLAKAYLLAGKESSSVEAAATALKHNGKNAMALSINGYYTAVHGDEKKGLGEIDKAIAANAGYCDAYFFKATYYKTKGDYFVNQARELKSYEDYYLKAIEWFSKDLLCDSANTNAYFARGLSYYRLKKYGETISNMTALLARDSSNIDAYILLAKAHDDNGETPIALKVIRKALLMAPGDKMALANQAAFIKHQQGSYSEATKALWKAVLANDTIAAIGEIGRKADVNATFESNGIQNNTVLQRAVDLGNYDLVKALLAAGADVNAVNSKKVSPLLYTTGPDKDYAKIAELLLQYKADIKLADADGVLPFNKACFNNSVEVAALLLKAGADINARDGVKRTPLMGAVKSGSPKLIKALLAGGADVNAVSIYGETPLFFALNAGPEFLLMDYLLVKNGARVTEYITAYSGGKAFAEQLPLIELLNKQDISVAMRKLFDPLLNSDNVALKKALVENPGTPKLILNYLLMASASLKNKTLYETLAAAGAERHYKIKGITAQALASVPVTEENSNLVAQVWDDKDKLKPASKPVASNTPKKAMK